MGGGTRLSIRPPGVVWGTQPYGGVGCFVNKWGKPWPVWLLLYFFHPTGTNPHPLVWGLSWAGKALQTHPLAAPTCAHSWNWPVFASSPPPLPRSVPIAGALLLWSCLCPSPLSLHPRAHSPLCIVSTVKALGEKVSVFISFRIRRKQWL